MRIGEVAKRFDISIETLRYYDKMGLLVPERRKKERDYCEYDLKKLQAILELKKMQFTLEEIKYCLEVDEQIDQGLRVGDIDKEMIQSQLKVIRAKYQGILQMEKDLQRAKGQLEHIMEKIEAFI